MALFVSGGQKEYCVEQEAGGSRVRERIRAGGDLIFAWAAPAVSELSKTLLPRLGPQAAGARTFPGDKFRLRPGGMRR